MTHLLRKIGGRFPEDILLQLQLGDLAPQPAQLVALGAPRFIRLNENPRMAESDGAAISTLRHSGTVHAVPRHRMPDTAPMAATLRY